MAAPGRPALREAAHILRQPFDVERRVLHVVADVVGVGLRVLDALLEVPLGAFVGSGVVDRLPLFEQLDRTIDPLRSWRIVRMRRDDQERCSCDAGTYPVSHDPPAFL